jgi:isoamyl acetate esterase
LLNVTLIGDSISRGYTPVVTELLAGTAAVTRPEAAGGTSGYILAMLEEWCVKASADVIHLNCGLHDIVRLYGPHKSRIPIAAYRENVRTILDTLVEFTDATVVWATTTPVNGQAYLAQTGLVCKEDDVVAYNQVGVAVAAQLGVTVNDLHGAVMSAGRDTLLRDDGVHYTEAGYRRLGQAVTEAIRSV